MTERQTDDVTRLLSAWSAGENDAEAELIPKVYSELRRIAGAHLSRERNDHTLQPTALVHEAFLRLTGQNRVSWRDRAHFFAIASNIMRRILVDYARSVGYVKRGGGLIRVALTDIEGEEAQEPQLVLEIDDLLDRLATFDSTKASIVELRFFGGLTEQETAEVLGCSARTVTRHWQMAKAWLLTAMNESVEAEPPGVADS